MTSLQYEILDEHSRAKTNLIHYQQSLHEEVIVGCKVHGENKLYFASSERARYLETKIKKFKIEIDDLELNYAEYFI